MAVQTGLDVIVIGAGLSGLRAAQLLASGASVCVLEARARPGGRALRHVFANGDSADLGGQWVGPGQDRLYRLAAAHGRDVWPLWDEGGRLIVSGRSRKIYRGTIPTLPLPVLLDLARMLARFETMAAGIDPERPWAHPKAAEWDRRTLGDWMDRTGFTRRARDMFAVAIAAVFACEPHELSLLHALFYARAGGSLDALLSVRGGAQQDRVRGDMGGLAEAMAEGLGDIVRYGEPARRIVWSAGGARVTTDIGEHEARRVILALPPNQALRIAFDPPLTAARDDLWRRMPPGACIKCIAQYETPFWRADGLSGQAVAADQPLRVAFDNTEEGKTAGLLMGFIEGDEARVWAGKPADERRAMVLDCFARWFGPRALAPVDYVDHDWTAEDFTRGCYAALMGPGVWTGPGRNLRDPVGPIHMAGTETAREWYGYFEGALEAAERAAAEVSAALRA